MLGARLGPNRDIIPTLPLALTLTLTLTRTRTLPRYAKNADLYYATLAADPALLLPVGTRTSYRRTTYIRTTYRRTSYPPPTARHHATHSGACLYL